MSTTKKEIIPEEVEPVVRQLLVNRNRAIIPKTRKCFSLCLWCCVQSVTESLVSMGGVLHLWSDKTLFHWSFERKITYCSSHLLHCILWWMWCKSNCERHLCRSNTCNVGEDQQKAGLCSQRQSYYKYRTATHTTLVQRDGLLMSTTSPIRIWLSVY